MTVMLLAAGLLTVAGCGAQQPAPVPTGAGPPSMAPSPAPTGPPSSAPSPAPTGPPGTDPAAPPGAAPPSSAPPVTEEGTTEDPPSTDGELPGALPHGQRRATGVVDKSGTCTILRVGARHWELTGPLADGLVDGAAVTVTGQVTTATGCTGNAVLTLIVDSVGP